MVVSGLPHHVTQRGNRREPIFFEEADVEVWAYCLMPNHVHLILNPRQPDGLGRAVWFFGGDGRDLRFPSATNHSPLKALPLPLSSRPKRTRISCHAALDKAACAPFCKGKRMKCTNATKFHRKSGGA
jgi:hypothetical protein